jgi:soluble lytic murein transglycosylase
MRVALFLFFLSQAVHGFSFGNGMAVPATILPPLPSSHLDPQSYNLVLDQSEKRCSNQGCRLWHQYIRAKFLSLTDKDKSCELFSTLAQEKEFPLYPFVLIRQTLTCSKNAKKEADLVETLKSLTKKYKFPGWIEQEIATALVNSAEFSAAPDLFDLSLAAAKVARTKAVKVDLLQGALEFAKMTQASQFQAIQKELFRVAPRLNLKSSDWIAVGNDAYSNHDYILAVKSYEKALRLKNIPLNLRHLILENLKTSYKATQKKDAAIKIAKKLWRLDSKENAKRALVSGLSYTRFLWTNHKDKEALQFLNAVEKKLKKKVLLPDLYFLRGRILEEQRNYKEALFWFARALSVSIDPVQKSSFAWNSAWLNYKMAEYEKARSLLDGLIKIETDQGKKFQELFWLAKSNDQLKRTNDSQKIYEQIIADDPIGYYAFLSYRELKRDIPTPSQSYHESFFSKLPKRLPTSLKIDWTLFDWLVSTGELEWARSFLDEEAPLGDGLPDGWEELFDHYAQASYFAPIFSRLNKLTSLEKSRLFANHGELIFPHKWNEFVDEGSRRSGLWPEYIFSIIRQESSFDPLAVSPADAYGLMQILPSVAQGLSGKRKQKISTADLLDPQNNITMGSRHLRKYWDIFDGQFVLTTAAYNASVDSVKGWLKSRYQGDTLVFIEDIPYEETRTYVKLVLRNFISYERMASSGQSVPFPEWCLEGIQVSNK